MRFLTAAIAAMLIAGCTSPTDILSQFVQHTPNTGRFEGDPELTTELRQLDQASYQHFKVFYRGRRQSPEIIILDIAGDRYSFDSRTWQRVDGGAAMAMVRKSIDAGRHVEAMTGRDSTGRILGLGLAVKDAERKVYDPGERRYVIRYQRFGRYEVAQVQATRRPESTRLPDELLVEGQ